MNIKSRPTTPPLRFPEFNGEWREAPISKYLKRATDQVVVEPDKKYREIGVRSHGRGIFHKEPVLGKVLGNKRVFYVHSDAFVVNIVFAWEQAIALTTENERGMIASHRFPMYVPRDAKVHLPFLLSYFKRKWGKHLLGLASPGGAGRNKTLGQTEFVKLNVRFPKIEEQEKIAAFLGAVDEKISQLERKKELLTQYKKGVMQQIFTQKIRFKDDNGNGFPPWEEKPFGKVYSFQRTNSLSRSDLDDKAGTFQNIHYGDIHSKLRPQFRYERESLPFVRSDVEMSQIQSESFCQPGDVVLADASEDYNDVGKAIEIVEVPKAKVLAGLHTILARPINNDFVVGFSGYLLRCVEVRRQVMRFAQGISVLGISKGSLAQVRLPIPCRSEQMKIATFLNSLDDAVHSISVEISRMQVFKQGLLQQMFA